MAIDTSIYGNIKPVQIENPLENYGRLMQLQQAQQQNRLAELVYGEKQREIGGDNALATLLAGGKSGADVSQGLAAAGYGNKSMAYTKAMQEQLKQQAEIGKTKAEASYKDVEAAHKRVELIGQGLGYLKDNPTLENAQGVIKHFVDVGIMPPEVAQQKLADFQRDPSPEGIRSLALMGYQGALSAKDQLPKIDTSNIGGKTVTQSFSPVTGKASILSELQNTQSPDNAATNATSRANNASTVGATIRGQNLVDSRSRETNALSREAQATIYDPERGILVNKATGLARPAATMDGSPVAPKDKPLTEFQGKSAAFGDRAMKADKILSDLTGNYSPTAVNVKQGLGSVWGVGGALEAGANMALGANSQKAEQAQRDFINALLRQESGAAISMGEFDNAKKQYFPQPGDSKEVVAQKAANRKTAIDGFIRSAGPSAKLQSPSAPAAPSANIDALLKKYGQ